MSVVTTFSKDVNMITSLQSLLREQVQGTFFLRSLLLDMCTQESLDEIFLKVTEMYQNQIALDGASSKAFTPIFRFVPSEEQNPALIVMQLLRHQGGQEYQLLASVELMSQPVSGSGAHVLSLRKPTWAEVRKHKWRNLRLETIRSKLTAIVGMIDKAKSTILLTHVSTLEQLIQSRPAVFVFDLEMTQDSIALISYAEGRLFSNLTVHI